MGDAPALPSLEVAWQCPTSAIYRNSDGNVFLMEWLDYNTSSQFRFASEKLLELMKESDAHSKVLLNDTEKLKIIGLSDQSWVRESILPRFVPLGVRRIAMVNSVHYFTRVGVQEIMRDQPEQASTEYFSTRDEALRWLLEGLGPR